MHGVLLKSITLRQCTLESPDGDSEGGSQRVSLWLQSKFGVEGQEQRALVRDVVQEYVRGLCWVMRYYYDGERRTILPGACCVHKFPRRHHEGPCTTECAGFPILCPAAPAVILCKMEQQSVVP